jgi:hypothetical protein
LRARHSRPDKVIIDKAVNRVKAVVLKSDVYRRIIRWCDRRIRFVTMTCV